MEEQTLDKILEDVKANSNNPELVKDNKYYFDFNEEWYRVRMPNQRELAEANKLRNITRLKFVAINAELVKQGKPKEYYFKDEIIKMLLETGIDIKKIDSEIEKLRKDFIQLAITVNQTNEKRTEDIEKLEQKANEIENRTRKLINEKAEHLSPAIEYQAEDAWYKYLVSRCTEKKIDEEKFENVWKSFEEAEKEDSLLPYVAEAHLGTLLQ